MLAVRTKRKAVRRAEADAKDAPDRQTKPRSREGSLGRRPERRRSRRIDCGTFALRRAFLGAQTRSMRGKMQTLRLGQSLRLGSLALALLTTGLASSAADDAAHAATARPRARGARRVSRGGRGLRRLPQRAEQPALRRRRGHRVALRARSTRRTSRPTRRGNRRLDGRRVLSRDASRRRPRRAEPLPRVPLSMVHPRDA